MDSIKKTKAICFLVGLILIIFGVLLIYLSRNNPKSNIGCGLGGNLLAFGFVFLAIPLFFFREDVKILSIKTYLTVFGLIAIFIGLMMPVINLMFCLFGPVIVVIIGVVLIVYAQRFS
jgi:uncharacterized membrane protein YczE